jgi:hypothetical protein
MSLSRQILSSSLRDLRDSKAYSKEAGVSWDEIVRELTNKQSSLENPGKAKF